MASAVIQGLGRAYGMYKVAQPHIKAIAQATGASGKLRGMSGVKGALARGVGDLSGLYKKGGKIKKGGQAVVHKGEAIIPASTVKKNKAVVDKLLRAGGKQIAADKSTHKGGARKGARKAYAGNVGNARARAGGKKT